MPTQALRRDEVFEYRILWISSLANGPVHPSLAAPTVAKECLLVGEDDFAPIIIGPSFITFSEGDSLPLVLVGQLKDMS